jgi:hypothetical protein
LPEGHVGEGVILAVAVAGFQSTFFVDEGRSPLTRNAPLVPVGFMIEQAGDGNSCKQVALSMRRRSRPFVAQGLPLNLLASFFDQYRLSERILQAFLNAGGRESRRFTEFRNSEVFISR